MHADHLSDTLSNEADTRTTKKKVSVHLYSNRGGLSREFSGRGPSFVFVLKVQTAAIRETPCSVSQPRWRFWVFMMLSVDSLNKCCVRLFFRVALEESVTLINRGAAGDKGWTPWSEYTVNRRGWHGATFALRADQQSLFRRRALSE